MKREKQQEEERQKTFLKQQREEQLRKEKSLKDISTRLCGEAPERAKLLKSFSSSQEVLSRIERFDKAYDTQKHAMALEKIKENR
jgi:hypothetical protein